MVNPLRGAEAPLFHSALPQRSSTAPLFHVATHLRDSGVIVLGIMAAGAKEKVQPAEGLHSGEHDSVMATRFDYEGPQPPLGEFLLACTPTPMPTGCEVKLR
jgi:hypothetical protein